MRLRRAFVLVALLFCALAGGSARADDFDLPGVANAAQAYAQQLHARAPAGGTPQAQAASIQAVAAAQAKGDPAARSGALAAAWEQRIAFGDDGSANWLELAQAEMHRAPPDARHALLAAWMAFQRANGAYDAEIPALLVMADALRAQHLDAQAAQTLEQVVQRAPDNDAYKRLLADAQRTAGLAVRRVTVEGEADPPRACIAFSLPPSRRSDIDPQDWITLDPPRPGAAITREGDQFCVSGLPSGAVTKATIRAGLPAEAVGHAAPLTLLKDAVVVLEVPNREPRIVFDTARFVLPTGQAPSVGLTTINLSAVSLRLVRLSERNVTGFVRDQKLGTAVDPWQARYQGEQNGRTVWEGSAPIPGWKLNVPAHTALPLPPPLRTAGPGLYAVIAGPGDGTPDDGSSIGAVQIVLRTDLAPTIWRGADGLTVQVRGYSDAAPKPGTKLRLLARNNDILGETAADADGVGRFAAPLLHGDGPLAPALLEAFGANDDYAALDLNAAAFDLSDRGVAGAPDPGPLDAYVWTDRGIYRPGETVQVQALLRDNAGQPADFPAQVTVRRPNGQVFSQSTPPRGGGAAVTLPVTLSAGAAAGTWVIEVRADPQAPPIGRAEFRVDAFVPDRLAVDIGKLPTALIPGQDSAIPVTARFLYGAPGNGLTGHGYATLTVDPTPFPALEGTKFGLEDDVFAPQPQDSPLPTTDVQGATSYTPKLAQAPDTTHPLKADILVEIDDPAGHGSKATATLPVRGTGPLIGIKPAFSGGEVDEGSDAAFDILALNPDGTRRALATKLRLVRERPDWHLVMHGRLASYETVYRDEPLETSNVSIPADQPIHYAKKLPFGRYRLEVTEAGGLAATSLRFRSGWAGTDNPDVPDRVDVSSAQRVVAAGSSARVHIAPPFAGKATLLVLSDRVQSVRTLDVPAAGLDVDVPVDTSWGPGAYVAVHLFRPVATDAVRPSRAIGLTWIGVDPAARTLPVSIEAAGELPPREAADIPIRATPGAWVSLAAVDEGILRLTRFVSPDPAPHFLGRRRLGLDIRDDWGRLIAPAQGDATQLKQGGDEGGFVLPDVPIRTVTLFAGPVQAGVDGVAHVHLDMPDFNGQVRLMAVAWQGAAIGAASRDVFVRDRLVAEPILPRFLAPGDTTRFAVLLQNLQLPAGHVEVRITVGGPLALPQSAPLATDLAQGARALLTTDVTATGAGRGTVRIDVQGPDGFLVAHEVAITVRPARAPTATVTGTDIPPGGSAALASPVPPDKFVPGTASVRASFGASVRYDSAGIATELAAYPLGCLEQTTSKGFALLSQADAPPGALAAAVASVLDRQNFDGGFSLWSANGADEEWLSAYAMDFLLRARDAGVTVPEAALADGLKFLAAEADREPDGPAGAADQAYRLYILARAGQGRAGAARVLAESPDSLPTPLARAQVAAALALAHDPPRAQTLFASALQAPDRGWWAADYGTALRDEAATAVLLRESGLLPDRLTRLAASLPGTDLVPRDLSTQEQAWLVAASAALGGNAVHVTLGARDLAGAAGLSAPLDGPVTARNLASHPVWASVSASGVLLQAPPAARNRMRVTRQFFTLDGGTLDLDHLTQNTVFVLVMEGRAEDGQAHRAMLLQGLPAGWEIAGRISGKPESMPWLGDLTQTEAEPAADDRYAAVLQLTAEKPDFRVAVRLRATTPGDYEIPGAELGDMYRPTIFAWQGTNRIKVLPAP